MSLLTICQSLSRKIGLDVPTGVISSTLREHIELIDITQDAAADIALRGDFGGMHNTATLTGTGANAELSLPSDFLRLTKGRAVYTSSGGVRGSLSDDEWFSLTPLQGTPRYFYKNGNMMSFYPYLASGATATISYMSRNWCSAGGELWTADSDTALVPESLVVKGAYWRWRRQKGLDFSDHMAEFEADLAAYAENDTRMR